MRALELITSLRVLERIVVKHWIIGMKVTRG